jgi:hypothetical protein
MKPDRVLGNTGGCGPLFRHFRNFSTWELEGKVLRLASRIWVLEFEAWSLGFGV